MGLLDMLGSAQSGNMAGLGGLGGQNINQLIQQFGGIQNVVKQLNKFLGAKGVNPKQVVKNNVNGKQYTPETINQFRQFAKQSGMTDDKIDSALREIGVIK